MKKEGQEVHLKTCLGTLHSIKSNNEEKTQMLLMSLMGTEPKLILTL